MVAMKTLTKVAACVAVGGITAAMIMKSKLEDRIRAQPYYKESLKLLRGHPGAIKVLGEPIKDLNFDVGEETKKYGNGRIDGFAVPVKGANTRGKYYFWAEVVDGDRWIIKRAELELANDTERRLSIRAEGNK